MSTHAIVVAAGNSSRMQGENKVFADLAGIPVIVRTLRTLSYEPSLQSITIVTQEGSFEKIKDLIDQYKIKKIKSIIEGGEKRQDSVWNGVHSLDAQPDDLVLVHNVCNPFVTSYEISSCVRAALEQGAAVLGFPLKDTIKKINDQGIIEKTLSREGVVQVQTPQCIRYELFVKGFQHVREQKIDVTDDVSIVEATGAEVKVVPCSPRNFKITTKDDLSLARQLMLNAKTLVGIGEDSHRFSQEKKELVLGGCVIPDHPGFDANSDGDVILHAAFNAISSCLGGRSLSLTADPLCAKGVTDSAEYLIPLLNELHAKQGELVHLSISIEAKTPKLEPHHESIKKSLSSIFCVSKEQIGLTFTTGEGLSGAGKGEGMYARVIATVNL